MPGKSLDGLIGYLVDRVALTGEYGEFYIDVSGNVMIIN